MSKSSLSVYILAAFLLFVHGVAFSQQTIALSPDLISYHYDANTKDVTVVQGDRLKGKSAQTNTDFTIDLFGAVCYRSNVPLGDAQERSQREDYARRAHDFTEQWIRQKSKISVWKINNPNVMSSPIWELALVFDAAHPGDMSPASCLNIALVSQGLAYTPFASGDQQATRYQHLKPEWMCGPLPTNRSPLQEALCGSFRGGFTSAMQKPSTVIKGPSNPQGYEKEHLIENFKQDDLKNQMQRIYDSIKQREDGPSGGPKIYPIYPPKAGTDNPDPLESDLILYSSRSKRLNELKKQLQDYINNPSALTPQQQERLRTHTVPELKELLSGQFEFESRQKTILTDRLQKTEKLLKDFSRKNLPGGPDRSPGGP